MSAEPPELAVVLGRQRYTPPSRRASRSASTPVEGPNGIHQGSTHAASRKRAQMVRCPPHTRVVKPFHRTGLDGRTLLPSGLPTLLEMYVGPVGHAGQEEIRAPLVPIPQPVRLGGLTPTPGKPRRLGLPTHPRGGTQCGRMSPAGAPPEVAVPRRFGWLIRSRDRGCCRGCGRADGPRVGPRPVPGRRSSTFGRPRWWSAWTRRRSGSRC
jgi:hypothetical protein